MLSKKTETVAVVVKCEPCKRSYYKVELGDALGEIYELTIHEQAVVDDRLIVGKELDKETFERLQHSVDYQKAYGYAIGILARRMYTEKEIRRKLYERETATDVICSVIDKLLENNLLDDVAYATIYIENQVNNGKKSRSRIISDLLAKGIEKLLIEDLANLFDEHAEIRLIKKEIERVHQRYSRQNLSDFDLGRKVIQNLARKGFEIYEVQRQYRFFIEDLKANEEES